MPGEAAHPADPLFSTSLEPTCTRQPRHPSTAVIPVQKRLHAKFSRGDVRHSIISGIKVPRKTVPLLRWMMPLDTGYTKGKPEPNHLQYRWSLW